MQALSSIADLFTAAFIACFLLNFLSWSRSQCADALLYIPGKNSARVLLYIGGLGGPVAFLLGIILGIPLLKLLGLVATNTRLCYMNIAAMVARYRLKRK